MPNIVLDRKAPSTHDPKAGIPRRDATIILQTLSAWAAADHTLQRHGNAHTAPPAHSASGTFIRLVGLLRFLRPAAWALAKHGLYVLSRAPTRGTLQQRRLQRVRIMSG